MFLSFKFKTNIAVFFKGYPLANYVNCGCSSHVWYMNQNDDFEHTDIFPLIY